MNLPRAPEQPGCQVFRHDAVVRPSDIDAARHLNHVCILGFFEYGRVRAHRDIRLARPDLPDMNTVVRHVSVDYLGQVQLFDALTVRSWIRRDGASSRTWAQELLRADGALVGAAEVTSVLVDGATSRPAPLPAIYREAFAAFRQG